jgi:hypothetical protein
LILDCGRGGVQEGGSSQGVCLRGEERIFWFLGVGVWLARRKNLAIPTQAAATSWPRTAAAGADRWKSSLYLTRSTPSLSRALARALSTIRQAAFRRGSLSWVAVGAQVLLAVCVRLRHLAVLPQRRRADELICSRPVREGFHARRLLQSRKSCPTAVSGTICPGARGAQRRKRAGPRPLVHANRIELLRKIARMCCWAYSPLN